MIIVNYKAIILLFLLLFVPSSFISTNAVGAVQNPILIVVENELRTFDIAPIIEEGRVLVPLRGVFELLQTEVGWNESEQKVTLQKGQTTVILKINDIAAFKNDQLIKLEVPAKISNGRTYVPLRFAAQAIGATVNWDNQNNTAYICLVTCGEQVAPPSLTLDQEAANSQTATPTLTVNHLSIGDSLQKVTAQMGKPEEIVASQYGFDWYIYHENYNNYLQVGISEGEIVAFYTNNDLFNLNKLISLKTSKQKVRSILGEPVTSIIKGNVNYQFRADKEWDLYLINDLYYLTVFYDIYENNNVTSIRAVQKQFELLLDGYYGIGNDLLQASYERQMFHLVNATRVREGLATLIWNDLIAGVAQDHSDDMAKKNYFEHTSLDGRSPFDRIEASGLDYRFAGENLAMGQFSAIFAHEGLMNSSGHRKNVLYSRYEQLGVGVSFQNNRPYFTQNYFSP